VSRLRFRKPHTHPVAPLALVDANLRYKSKAQLLAAEVKQADDRLGN
jgi:hypothetical protein